MAVYSVHGKLGVGKTKLAVWRAQIALREGLRVASNVDLFQPITPERALRYTRIPDKPTAADLEALGHGNPDTYDEDRNGVLILDELGSWLNARSFQDKSRAGVIDWFIHARKRGWNIYLIVQDEGMIDKQVRDALIEYSVRCMRMDKVRIPVLGKLLGLVGRMCGFKKWGYLPRFHMATARVGYGEGALVAERWMFRGDELHAAYDTRQVFTASYPHATHSVLPAWDFAPPVPKTAALVAAFRRVFKKPAQRPPLKPKLPHVQRIATLHPDRRLAALRAARHPKVQAVLVQLEATRHRAASLEALDAIERAAASSRHAVQPSDSA